MSLLQGLLRSKGTTTYGDARMDEDGDIETSDSDYEFVSVVSPRLCKIPLPYTNAPSSKVSIPGTPARSRPVSPDPEPVRRTSTLSPTLHSLLTGQNKRQ